MSKSRTQLKKLLNQAGWTKKAGKWSKKNSQVATEINLTLDQAVIAAKVNKNI